VRKPINRFFVALAGCVLAAWMLAGDADAPQLLTPVNEKPRAPDLTMENVDGGNVRLASLHGKVVLVFWATWCAPCRREMPAMERLNRIMKDKPFAIVAINAGEGVDEVFSFRGSVDPMPTFQLLLDPKGDAMAAFEVKGLPTTFILNRQGQIVYRAVGGRKFDDPRIIATLQALADAP
jgi:Thiol-disulfide isomerase and thioredoxins